MGPTRELLSAEYFFIFAAFVKGQIRYLGKKSHSFQSFKSLPSETGVIRRLLMITQILTTGMPRHAGATGGFRDKNTRLA